VEEYALYRYHGGEWVELNTTVVTEADSYYVVRATSPGLSDFTSGVKQPKFRLVDGNVTVTKITTGEDVGVRVKIRNDGGADGTYTTKLLLNDEVVSQKDATISADSKRVVTFEQEISDPGTYTVVVNNVTISDVEVTAEELNQTASNPDGTSDPGGEGETNTRTPGFGLLVAIVALLAGAVLLGRRD
jgi:PGF-CTERM protein